ncbi:hypothetical protein Godav_019987 [Gossypium davidsonii]|uniref:Uncharacterized protein n=1 Tax=Gossypium davidsonii TaxID=34287 RepID=A0A7J8R313_GOSDV|nr:hypothetical protein [Gossypium davidsonii]
MVDPIAKQPIVWKDKLIGHSSISGENSLEEKEDFNLLEGDIQKSINMNGIHSIQFSDRIHQILIRLLGLPGYLYKRKILVEIRGMVGKVTKLDMNTDNRAREDMPMQRKLAPLGPLTFTIRNDIRKSHNEIFEHNNGQLGSGALDKGQLNELGFRNMVGPVRVNSVASRSSIGPVSSSNRTNGFQIVDDRFSEGLREKRNGLDLNGSLGVKAYSLLDKAMEGSEQVIPGSFSTTNLVMEGMVGIAASVMVGSLDPNKHTAVIFKENKNPNADSQVEGNTGLVSDKRVDRAAGRGSGDKIRDGRDLGYIDPSFTWQRGGTFERLDWALANDTWVIAFPQCLVSYLSHIKSDYGPILLNTRPDLSLARERPFRFLMGWTKHANFSTFVKNK